MTLSAPDLLAVWETGHAQQPAARALTLLAAVYDGDAADAAVMPIGRRDAMLLTLREETFGTSFTGVTNCAECAEAVELQFTSADVRAAAAEGAADQELSVAIGERSVRFRLPDSADLIALAGVPEEVAADVLLARCVETDETLPAEVIEAIEARMAAADPLAVLQFTISCPWCGAAFARAFDIEAFLWREVESSAIRLVRDVHVLASAYGWSEEAILAMTPSRRQLYAELVR